MVSLPSISTSFPSLPMFCLLPSHLLARSLQAIPNTNPFLPRLSLAPSPTLSLCHAPCNHPTVPTLNSCTYKHESKRMLTEAPSAPPRREGRDVRSLPRALRAGRWASPLVPLGDLRRDRPRRRRPVVQAGRRHPAAAARRTGAPHARHGGRRRPARPQRVRADAGPPLPPMNIRPPRRCPPPAELAAWAALGTAPPAPRLDAAPRAREGVPWGHRQQSGRRGALTAARAAAPRGRCACAAPAGGPGGRTRSTCTTAPRPPAAGPPSSARSHPPRAPPPARTPPAGQIRPAQLSARGARPLSPLGGGGLPSPDHCCRGGRGGEGEEGREEGERESRRKKRGVRE
jgi:hypothetical protein